MFEPNIFNFHTCNITDKHFPKYRSEAINFRIVFANFQTATGFSSFQYAIQVDS
ncbi:hypothetical protein LDENG_00192290 [Lucifuga dentata]|nr:hypothetical protein LDENG_00192290 [Lucifuga dentata]